MIKYKLKYKIINNKNDVMEFRTYETAKKIYIALAENVTIKAAKLYEIKDNKKKLLEKFKKNLI